MRLSRATQLTAALLLVGALAFASRASAQLILVGNDEKVGWDDGGKVVLRAPGKDTSSIVDIANREAPRIIASLPLMNSLFGPAINRQITVEGTLANTTNTIHLVLVLVRIRTVPTS